MNPILRNLALRLIRKAVKAAAKNEDSPISVPAKLLLEIAGTPPAEFGMDDKRRERLEVASRVLASLSTNQGQLTASHDAVSYADALIAEVDRDQP